MFDPVEVGIDALNDFSLLFVEIDENLVFLLEVAHLQRDV
jgi:hypothetical protein